MFLTNPEHHQSSRISSVALDNKTTNLTAATKVNAAQESINCDIRKNKTTYSTSRLYSQRKTQSILEDRDQIATKP